jgi:preprotein translocase subunit SecD
MSRSPPLRAALLATLLVLAPVAVAGAVPAAATGAAPTADEASDRGPPTQSVTTQANVTVLNVTVVGRTAVGAAAEPMVNVTGIIANELDLSAARVRVDRRSDTVEVLANRSDEAILAALREADIDTEDVTVRRGVSNTTRDAVAAALRERIVAAGLDGNTSVAAAGDSRLRIRTTAVSTVRAAVTVRGDVGIVAGSPGSDGTQRVELVDASGIAEVGSVRVRSGGAPYVPVTLTDAAARNFSRTLVDNGFTDEANTSSCRYDESPDAPGYCIFTVVDGEVVYAASLSPGLADVMRNGEFVEDPQFVVTAANESTARSLATTLRTGPLPAPVRVVNTTTRTGTTPFTTPGADTASPTPSPTPTPDVDATPTAGAGDGGTPTPDSGGTPAADDGGATDEPSDAGAPGFGVSAALAALLALTAGLVRRRQSP